jgi:CBS domain-containing protein
MGTNVKDVMTTRPRAVTPDTELSQVAELMASEDIGVIPVVKEDRLLGLITDRDIVVRAVAKGKDPRGMPVSEVATEEVVAVGADDDLSNALRLMAHYQVRRLPVVDSDNRLIGVVSQADVALTTKEKTTGEVVESISQAPAGPRVQSGSDREPHAKQQDEGRM